MRVSSPAQWSRATSSLVHDWAVDPAAAPGWPSALAAKGAPGEFRNTECGHLRDIRHFDVTSEKVGLRLDDQSCWWHHRRL